MSATRYDREIEQYRSLMEVPSTFTEGFSWTSLVGALFIALLMVPGAIIALIGAHLYLVVKMGTTAPPWVRADTKPKSSRSEKV